MKLYLGRRLRRLRRELGLNQSAMAAEIGVSPFLSEPSRAQPAAGDRAGAAEARRNLRHRPEELRGRGRRGDRRRPARRDFRRSDVRRPRRAALRAGRDGGQCPGCRRRRRAALRGAGRIATPARGRGGRRRRDGSEPAGLGPRPYPGQPQPFRLSGGGGGDPGRRARRSAVHRRADAAAAEGGVRHRDSGSCRRSCSTAPASITTCTASG